MLTVNELYDLSHSLAGDYLKQFTYPWEALAGISDLILEIGKQLPEDEYVHPTDWDGNVLEDVWVAKDATVFKTAYLHGPCIIGHRTEVRQCAFIRGSALVGNDCVVGNSTELKNCILFDCCQVPHFNYVGDSVLGFHSHFGAGAVTSNVRADRKPVVVHGGPSFGDAPTGLSKLGAFVGDYVEVGCNSVICPGAVIGRRSIVYPLSFVRGVVEEDCIFKNNGVIVEKRCDS